MASKKLVEIVQRGPKLLAKWRHQNPDIVVDLSDANLNGVNLRGANLRRAKLFGARMREADLIGANLTGADLTRTDLGNARLIKADFYTAELTATNLGSADLSGAYLRKTTMTGADLSDANLTKADFIEADLSQASFLGANLTEANLSQTILTKANFEKATFDRVVLGNVDLSGAHGLDKIEHRGPSTMGIDTFYQSHAGLSEEFLRGCGVPQGLITNVEAIAGNPSEKFFCYIYYVKEENLFVDRVYESLQNKGVRCWLIPKPVADEDGKPTKDLTREIGPRDKIVLCASRSALRSKWMNEKVDSILDIEAEFQKTLGKDSRVLYPLNLDGFMFTGDWKFKREKLVTTRVAADFTGWRRNAEKFDQELDVLIKRLQGEKVKK